VALLRGTVPPTLPMRGLSVCMTAGEGRLVGTHGLPFFGHGGLPDVVAMSRPVRRLVLSSAAPTRHGPRESQLRPTIGSYLVGAGVRAERLGRGDALIEGRRRRHRADPGTAGLSTPGVYGPCSVGLRRRERPSFAKCRPRLVSPRREPKQRSQAARAPAKEPSTITAELLARRARC
jgi:hypothetical protein